MSRAVYRSPPHAGRRWVDVAFPVRAAQAHMRLDVFLSRAIPRLSRTRIRSVIEGGGVRIEGRVEPPRPGYRLRAGQVVTVRRPVQDEPPCNDAVEVLHEDPAVLAVNKPGDLVVHPSARYHHRTVTGWLRRTRGAAHPWRLIHRLDRETSGVLVLAAAGPSEAFLKRAFQCREVGKQYLAVCWGHLAAPVTADVPLGPAANSPVRVKMGPCPDLRGGKPAVTCVHPLAHGRVDGRPVTLVRAEPRTGRQHQVRAHLSWLGHPVVGDKLYGEDETIFLDLVEGRATAAEAARRAGFPRQALHAFRLAMPHPLGGRLEVTAPYPPDLAGLVPLPADRAG